MREVATKTESAIQQLPPEAKKAPLGAPLAWQAARYAAPSLLESVATVALPVTAVGGIAGMTYYGAIKPLGEQVVRRGMENAAAANPGSWASRALSERTEAKVEARLAEALKTGRVLYGSDYELAEEYVASVRATIEAEEKAVNAGGAR